MGSNPISPTILVLDTSPLQAIFRADLLPVLRTVFARIFIPGAVYEETLASVVLARPGMVPRLELFPWIGRVTVSDEEIAQAGAVLIRNRRSTERYQWFDRYVDRPEVEAVLLAKRESALAVIEDSNGVKCANDLGVQVVNVADLLLELESQGHIPDAQISAERIMETGYYSKELRWLAWRQPKSN